MKLPILLTEFHISTALSVLIYTYVGIVFLQGFWLPFVDSQNIFKGRWKTDKWEDCKGTGCGLIGLQLRSVRCYDPSLDIPTPPSRCDLLAKPVDNRKCFIICEEHINQFQWLHADWQPCQLGELISNQPCNGGFAGTQHRNVSCVGMENNTLVVGNEVCTQLFGTPATEQSCFVPCPVNCVTSMFGEWSHCSVTCGNASQIRFRQVIRLPKDGGKSCPPLYETRFCPNLPSCTSQRTVVLGNWSSCEHTKISSRKNKKVLQYLVGSRKREVSCISSAGEVLAESFILTDTCIRTVNCSVSTWSNWGLCSASCGGNGTQNRTRSIERLPSGAESFPCPPLVEHRSCNVTIDGIEPCSRYKWFAGSWTTCTPIYNTTCGGGLQSRQLFCVREPIQDLGSLPTSELLSVLRPVDDRLCQYIERPLNWQECDISCEPKYELSLWSDWSDCALPLCPGDHGFIPSEENLGRRETTPLKGFKRRVRRIHKFTDIPQDCPHVLEVIPCVNARCFSWKLDSISPCRSFRGSCGAGSMTAQLSCRDMWGNEVEEEKCDMSPDFALESNCSVPCPNDCVLSDWSPWSPCPYTCKQGKRVSASQKRKRIILALPGSGGKPCADELVQEQPCNQHKCSVYHWKALRWSKCTANRTYDEQMPGVLNGTWLYSESAITYQQPMSCKGGFQSRKVVCKKKTSDRVKDKFCLPLSKPSTVRSCPTPCDRDCILSQWSSWSDCERECEKWINRENILPISEGDVEQRQSRFVIQQMSGVGNPCLRQTNRTQTCGGTRACPVYNWRVEKWGPCTVASGVQSVDDEGICVGVRTRVVSCRIETAVTSHKVALELCLEAHGTVPHAAKLCRKDCVRDMAFDEWLTRYSCGLQQPPILIDESDENRTPVPLNPVTQAVGPWSSCFIDVNDLKNYNPECPAPDEVIGETSNFSPEFKQCGMGKRKRALRCVDQDSGHMYPVSFCDYRTFDWEECEIPCPSDCIMSGWSGWGSCRDLNHGRKTSLPSPRCGESVQVRFSYRSDDAVNGGRRCPALDDISQTYEREPCRSECRFHFWSDRSFSDSCQLTNTSASCGKGIQLRSVHCYRSCYWKGFPNSAIAVDDDDCDITHMTYGSNPCRLPCLNECVLSEWSNWGDCENLIGLRVGAEGSCAQATRRRTRVVLREPTASSGCSILYSLEETEGCSLNENCYTYSTEWVEWSSCKLAGDAKCGLGLKKRRANCVQSDGVPVPFWKCEYYGVTIPDPQILSCRVNCPVDCQVSDWTAWSSCSGGCRRSRAHTRTRKILREASDLGRSCPTELQQTKPCCWLPCYEWRLQEWGECGLTHGICGEGLQQRRVACVQEDGIEVHASMCRSYGAVEPQDRFAPSVLSRPCHVICPGSCQLTEWSTWSGCHGDCGDGTMVAGRKTRSRSSYMVGDGESEFCPSSEIEELSCPIDEAVCYTYNWKASHYINGLREVWCERDPDGKRVSAGCVESLKPSQIKPPSLCSQDCETVEDATCGEGGWCVCMPPKKGEYRADSQLLACNNEEKADDPYVEDRVKTIAEETTTSPYILISAPDLKNETTKWPLFHPFNEDGSLKPWAYAAIAGLLVLLIFIIAVIYLLCSACRRAGKSGKKLRHRPSNGSNMGMVVTSTGGCSVYGTGGNGPPPYYVNAPKKTQNSHYTHTPGFVRTPSERSAQSYPDRYNDDFH